MGLLHTALSSAPVSVEAGVWCLPPATPGRDVERTARFVAQILDTDVVSVPWAACRPKAWKTAASQRRPVLCLCDISAKTDRAEVLRRLGQTHAASCVVAGPLPCRADQASLQALVDVAAGAVGAALADPAHPLAHLRISELDVGLLASACDTPVDLEDAVCAVIRRVMVEAARAGGHRPWAQWSHEAVAGLVAARIARVTASQRGAATQGLVLSLDGAQTLEGDALRSLHRVGLIAEPTLPATWSRLALAVGRPGVRMTLQRTHPDWPWRLVRPASLGASPGRSEAVACWTAAVAVWCLRPELEPGLDAMGVHGLCQAVDVTVQGAGSLSLALRPWLELLTRLATGRGRIPDGDVRILSEAEGAQLRLSSASSGAGSRFAVAALFDSLALVAGLRSGDVLSAAKRWPGLSWTLGRLGASARPGLAWLRLRMAIGMSASASSDQRRQWRAELEEAADVLGAIPMFRPAVAHAEGWLSWAEGDAQTASEKWAQARELSKLGGDVAAAARYALDVALASTATLNLPIAAQQISDLRDGGALDGERVAMAAALSVLLGLSGVGPSQDPDDAFDAWRRLAHSSALPSSGDDAATAGALVRCGALLAAGRSTEALQMLEYLASSPEVGSAPAPRLATRIAQGWCLVWLADPDAATASWQQAVRLTPSAAPQLAARLWRATSMTEDARLRHAAAAAAMAKALRLSRADGSQSAESQELAMAAQARAWIEDPSWPQAAKRSLLKLLTTVATVALSVLTAGALAGCGSPTPASSPVVPATVDAALGDSLDAAAANQGWDADGGTADLKPVDGKEATPAPDAEEETQVPGDTPATLTDSQLAEDAVPGEDSLADSALLTDTSPTDTLAEVASPTGLALTVYGSPALSGNLNLLLFTPEVMAQPNGPNPSQAKLLETWPVKSWPFSGVVDLPSGTWVLGALLTPGAFDPMDALAMGFGCKGGKSIGLSSDGAYVQPPSLSIALVPMDQTEPISLTCGGGLTGTAPESLLATTFQVTPPSTQAGGAHLLDGEWVEGKYWVAGHQDGWVSFDLDGATLPVGLAGWQTHPKGLCSRMERVGSWLACSSRRPQLFLTKAVNSSGTSSDYMAIQLAQGQLADGMTERAGRLLVAVHQAGLATREAAAPFDALSLTVDATLTDAWDVAVLGPNHIAVADGAGGLVIAEVDATWEVKQVAQLALPGLSSLVHSAGAQLVVGSASGHLSAVDASDPTKPVLQWTMPTPWPVFGASVAGDLVLAAGGPVLWAVNLPPVGAPQAAPVVRDAEFSYHYAMDIDPLGAGAVSAEFAVVRTLSINPTATVGPQAVIAKAIYAKPAKVGDDVLMNLRIWSVGSQPVQVTQVAWVEDADKGGNPSVVAGAEKIGPFSWSDFKLTAPKTQKGITKHLLKVQFDPPGEIVVLVKEVTTLLPGDPLPALVYQSAAGKDLDVNKWLAGKPGVVIVAAHSCPVAFQALSALSNDLAPALAAGTVRAVAIDPWDKPGGLPEVGALKANFPVLFSPLTTSDNHNWSNLLQSILTQPADNAAPMPIVYVVDAAGKIVDARQGYEPKTVFAALGSLVVLP